ncbi:MAG: IS256 family transposase [Elusimicrobia bacterium]|nr:IS256 family transposase [Elusimicrobiota bacterium]
MLTTSQLRRKVRMSLQPGTLSSIVATKVSTIILESLNAQLIAERDAALARAPYERLEGPKRNGVKPVRLMGFFGEMWLRRPVVRSGSLRLPLLDALKSAGTHLRDLLAARFWLRGTSTRAVAEELRSAIGAKMSASTVSRVTNALEPVLRAWESSPIPAGIQYLFLDAIYLPVRRPGFTSEQALLLALGVDGDGRRHVLGFALGDRESKDSWAALIKDLLARGLDRQVLHLVISDEHKGIESAVSELLAVAHQLCVVHLERNVKHKVAAPDWKDVLADFHRIFWTPNRDESVRALGAFEGRWAAAYPRTVALVTRRFEDHVRFFAEPDKFWTLLRCTNLIERFNRELRRRLNPAGAMHSELKVSKLVWAVAEAQKSRWNYAWKPRGVLKIQQPRFAHA